MEEATMQTPSISPSLTPIGSSGATAHGTAESAGNAWHRVRIDRLDLERASPSAAFATARACVDLGHLLPVDVEAELSIEGGPDASLPDVTTERMWVSHSYQNGHCLFEAHLPERTISTARCLRVCVRPSEAMRGRRALHATSSTMTLELPPSSENCQPVPPEVRDAPSGVEELPPCGVDPEC
jgi:hypothetical protein